MKSSSQLSRGYVIALTATVIWSTTGIIISYLSKTYSLPSLVLAFWRDLFVSFGMAVGLLVFSRPLFQLDRKHWGFMVWYGLTLAIFNSMWTFSVQYNGAAVATVMAFSSPAMTAILSRIVLKEQFSRIKIFSILLSLAGIIFVSGAYDPSAWNLNPLGIIFGLLSGLLFAIYNLEGKHASDTHIDSWTALLYSFAWATVFLFFFNLGNDLFLTGKGAFADLLWLGDSVSGWGLLFFLGVAPTLGGFGLYTLSIRYLSPTTSNLIATLEPAFTAIWAYFLLNEVLTGTQLFGGLLVLMGVVLLRFGEK
ncbi:MAG: DMT family transporter [Anaerolineales bacterium]|uniref:DMT family transporter n=1 Tax=Candidatus Villigracilis affinis TaxID=3140682 RepID=UPI001DCC04E5|nr:DMT family transporter [Anaerolineales bacterium]MBK9600326.1 DMT family transporter [Anaerolineales bacterium]